MIAEQHALHSVLRERIVEHLLVGGLLQKLWEHGNTSVEILRSEFDRGGYDLVADFGAVTRHVQLKCSRLGGSTRSQKLSLNLARKPSGCVIWIVLDDKLNFCNFLWLGDEPGKPLPDIDRLKVAKHVKGDATGHKAPRPNLREVPMAKFKKIPNLEGVLDALFGVSWRESL